MLPPLQIQDNPNPPGMAVGKVWTEEGRVEKKISVPPEPRNWTRGLSCATQKLVAAHNM